MEGVWDETFWSGRNACVCCCAIRIESHGSGVHVLVDRKEDRRLLLQKDERWEALLHAGKKDDFVVLLQIRCCEVSLPSRSTTRKVAKE
jgi:hypothetical protein